MKIHLPSLGHAMWFSVYAVVVMFLIRHFVAGVPLAGHAELNAWVISFIVILPMNYFFIRKALYRL